MKGYLYILRLADGRYYVGSTTNLARRLHQHQTGHTLTTRNQRSFELMFSQEFNEIQQARQAEAKIKRWKRRDFIEKVIQDGKMTSID